MDKMVKAGKTRCVGNASESECIQERYGVFTVWRRSSDEAKDLMNRLLPDPDQVFSKGQTIPSLWRSAATDKVRIEFGGQTYFFKRYNLGGFVYQLKNVFRPSKALRSWLAVGEFVTRDIPTPRPLLCIEERQVRFLGRSYLLFPFIQGETGSFLDLWPILNQDERSASLAQLAGIIGRMHHRGLFHGDLNWRNILARRSADGLEFFLVDLDGYRIPGFSTEADGMKDLDHFIRDLRRAEAGEKLENDFLRQWRMVREGG